MRGNVVDHSVIERTEDVDKEKKKKRRPNRRCKQNSPASGYSSSKQYGLDLHGSNEHGLSKASKVAFNSMPIMHLNERVYLGEDRVVQNQLLILSDLGQRMYPKSCPVEIACEEAIGFSMGDDFPPPHQNGGDDAQRKFFARHWSIEAVSEALERGDLFKAIFRVNAYNRLEAYCTIDGVKSDVLISGIAAQNRAVEGDIVVIKVDPLSSWTRMKGSSGPLNNSGPMEERNLLPEGCADEWNGSMNGLEKICAAVSSFPFKRPTGRVVSIIEKSPRRNAVVGFLSAQKGHSYREAHKKDMNNKKNSFSFSSKYIQLTPMDPKFPKMRVPVEGLPDCIKNRLEDGDATVETELVAARIDDWCEESPVPQAQVMHIFGQCGEIEPHIAAILFENAIQCSEFSSESLSCLPRIPWEVPSAEYASRRDLRNLCIFTIDPSTATDLDDALSVERLSNGISRVGVHIADVSYFVQPDTALDIEAQIRSTSVYILRRKLPMLPPLLSENIGSLIPGVDRLAFSIFWDINLAGDVVDRWIGRTVVRSCCKLSYEQAQNIIDGLLDVESLKSPGDDYPQLHGPFDWLDVIQCVKVLSEISKTLKDNRFNDGALRLENSKVVFLFDEDGVPYDSMLCERVDSNFLIEEFMLLANRTAAEIISRVFPDSALLRRHPEPDMRKLREFEAFCRKHGLELDASSSGQLHHSLERIKEELKNDSVLFDILISYALKPMQLATYFCSGDIKPTENDWGHYALAVPIYTHFTSPLRRYPDIIVHRSLAAAMEAEDMYLKNRKTLQKANREEEMNRCFTGMNFDKDAADSKEGQEALLAAALKHRISCTEVLSDVAAHCNERGLASRHAKDACDRLYMWIFLKKKGILLSEARVLGLGPRFMSIYIPKLAIERRIYYDDVEGLMVEWLDTTSTLVLSFSMNKRFQRRGGPGKYRTLEDVAWVISPYYLKPEMDVLEDSVGEGCATQIGKDADLGFQDPEPIMTYGVSDVDPLVFPVTLRLLSTIPVALCAVGGNDGPVDIGARLYIGSYFGYGGKP
ncbi:DIS3-like exonuclease 2 isoform X2 [Malania oleifera]|uniref:DIS3-like exonuclease 2 isoform X2 n=1 Tax=Malania oleifera TaxID=397392 RepID=UPI0025AE55F2|nr:DIS3-like exonuclease 2 isoform X2 [Malania oleifera]